MATGLQQLLNNTQTQASQGDEANIGAKTDWRVKLSLAAESNYLYNLPGAQGILAPLMGTNGIIFPYTPSISIQYAANYSPTELTHSNYKIFQYKNSSVDNISITCDFTAQDTSEANYVLAVIHFLRSVTKMFYGRDQNPKSGTPPPLCYLSGLGEFQFNEHPLVISTFTYNLPTDVDYIRANSFTGSAGVNRSAQQEEKGETSALQNRSAGRIGPGGTAPGPQFERPPGGTVEPTYVPTKLSITINAYPIVTRADISNKFSLRDYATGALLTGRSNTSRSKISKGIW